MYHKRSTTQSQITFTNRNSLLIQQLRGSALSVVGGNSPFSALMTLHSEDEVQCMVSLITSNAAAVDDIVEQIYHLPVHYAACHPHLVTD